MFYEMGMGDDPKKIADTNNKCLRFSSIATSKK